MAARLASFRANHLTRHVFSALRSYPTYSVVSRLRSSVAGTEKVSTAEGDTESFDDNRASSCTVSPLGGDYPIEDEEWMKQRGSFQEQLRRTLIAYDMPLPRYMHERSQVLLEDLEDPPGKFVDLRLAERDVVYPEGVAGERQGIIGPSLELGRTPKIMRREAADKIIEVLDAIAAGEKEWGEKSSPKMHGGEAPQSTVAEESSIWEEIMGEVGEEDMPGQSSVGTEVDNLPSGSRVETIEDMEEETEEEIATRKFKAQYEIAAREAMARAQAHKKGLKPPKRVIIKPRQRSFLLDGVRGSGKSCTLNHIVMHARSTGWIVIFQPASKKLMTKGIYCQPNPHFQDMYDLPKHSTRLLQALLVAHGEQLKEVHIQDPKVSERHEGAESLFDIADRAKEDELLAGTAHHDVMRELLSTKEAKVLLAVDEYNELFQPSVWHYGDNKVDAHVITATQSLMPAVTSSPTGITLMDEDDWERLEKQEVEVAEKAAKEGGSKKMSPQELAVMMAQDKPDGEEMTTKDLIALQEAMEAMHENRGVCIPRPPAERSGACLPLPPANGIAVCATSGRYPPIKKVKKKSWIPYEERFKDYTNAVKVPVGKCTYEELEMILIHYAISRVVWEPLSAVQVARTHAKSDGVLERIYDCCIHSEHF